MYLYMQNSGEHTIVQVSHCRRLYVSLTWFAVAHPGGLHHPP